MNLRNKLFTAFLGLIIIPLLVLGLFTFFVTYNSIEKKYSQQAEYSLKAIGYSILNVFDEMENVTDTGIVSSVFTTALKADDPDSQDFITNSEQLNLNSTQRNFRNLMYNHPAISYAFLYNMNKDNSQVSIFTKENFESLEYKEFKKTHLYQEVVELNGVPKWIAPHEYPEMSGMEPVFTQIRLVKNIETFRKEGILVVQIKRLEFERIFRNLTLPNNLQDTSFLLVNDEGLILFDPKEQNDGENMKLYINREIDYHPEYQSFKSKFDGEESVVSIHKLEGYPWSLVSVTSWETLSQEVTSFAKWFLVILGLCLVTAVAFNKFFMNRITGTIAIIVRFMRRVEDGDLSARVEEKGEDELLLLSRGYNDLMDRINRQFDQIRNEQRLKTEAHMRVLQAQIKPHFLFNTLESINVLAVQNEGRKVSEMVYRLASILRISIQEREEITLEEELRYLKSYLEIQKFRFEDVFDYEIDVPKELLSCRIMKLTLQPLVENSIQHGFEGLDYKGLIMIKAWTQRGNLIVHVEDNGWGMTSKQLSVFAYMMPEEKNPVQPGAENLKLNQERRGLGLRSVADRIRIQYGDGYGLFICSSQPGGTVIHCVIPNYGGGEGQHAKGSIGG